MKSQLQKCLQSRSKVNDPLRTLVILDKNTFLSYKNIVKTASEVKLTHYTFHKKYNVGLVFTKLIIKNT